MVRLISILILTHSFYFCASQGRHSNKEVFLDASFSKDNAILGDALEINLYYKNNLDETFNLYPEATIGLIHKHKEFITYDSPERIVYRLHEFSNHDSIVCLEPGEDFMYTFNITVDSNFFYEGVNIILVYYHFFDKSAGNKKRKKSKQEPTLSLWSPPIKIEIKTNE